MSARRGEIGQQPTHPAPERPPVREIEFELEGRRCVFEVDGPGDPDIPSIFLLGLPKAGSTLLNRLMKPVSKSAGLTWVAVQEIMFSMGVATPAIPPQVNEVFRPAGYAFGGFRSLPPAVRLPAYASGRTVLLVRDPRDMLTSLYFSLAESHRPPGESVGGELAARFHQQREQVNLMGIDAFALANVGVVAGQFEVVEKKLTGVAHKLYRYEDVIFDKAGFVDDMLAYLGLSVRPAVVQRVAAANDVRPEIEDTSQHIRKVSPGDHLDKLKPETIAALDHALGEILRRYHYA